MGPLSEFKKYILEILTGSKSLLIGMGITFKRLFMPIVTVQYPRQKLTMTPNFRGHIEAIYFDDTKSHHCVACGLCVRTCPSHVIKVQGEKEKALQVAEKGLQKGKGRMDELRLFLVARAEETGDRGKYLALQFAQTVDGLTLVKYQAFQQLCAPEEWTVYEPQIRTRMQKSWGSEQLKIHMHREEYAEALALLIERRYPTFDGSGDCEIQTAKALEQRYPEEILKFYHTGLGHLNENNQRQEYTRKAVVVAKICHVLVQVLGDVARWQTFAGKIKRDNFKRPAFQDEFASSVGDVDGE